MIVGEGTATVSVSPREVFEFVLDLNRYREADFKIGRVGTIVRDGDRGTVRFSGRIMGIPSPPATYPFTIRGSRLQFGSPIAGLNKWLLEFDGAFDCETTDAGTVVFHREAFTFKDPLRWIIEPLLRRWLAADTVKEMVRFKEIIER